MRVLQVTTNVQYEISGPSYSVTRLCRSLHDNGVYVELHMLEPAPFQQEGFKVVTYKHDFTKYWVTRRLGISGAMRRGLTEACENFDIIHSNAMWMMTDVYPGWAVVQAKKRPKFVMSPRGSLAQWSLSHGRFRKMIFGALLQYPVCRKVDMWHATSEKEYLDIRAAGYTQPVAIVPIGMDFMECTRSKCTGLRRMVFMGRIHKVKGCDRLLLAWERLHNELKDWELEIAGGDYGALSEAMQLIKEKKLPRVKYLGALFGEEKYKFLADADLYVLPTATENFGITIAESLAVGTPVITTTGTLWSGLNGVDGIGRSGWWIKNTVDDLVSAIKEAAAMSPAELEQWGLNGQKWVRRDFDWRSVGQKMEKAYNWLVNGGERPDYVKVD